jgi:hopanoid biosynthesis associated protein HpnK
MGFNSPRRLIVNADDFGRSHSINQAVIRAHREGILTTTSLMVNEEAAVEAVELARQNPRLGIGLHLTLVRGRATLGPDVIPGLVDQDRNFSNGPVAAGCKLFFNPSLFRQLEQEIAAQFSKFAETGLTLDHVNGHLNIHLHPTVLRLLLRHKAEWHVDRLRLTRDPFRLNVALARGSWGYRLSHALIFGALSRWAAPQLRRHAIRHTAAVFGLLQTSAVNESFVLGLLERLPPGNSELYSHPCLEKFRDEADALVSPKVRRSVLEHGIELIRYQDL